MAQTALDDEELFGEAASEMQSDVEEALAAARAALPTADEVWETTAENVLGTLNGLKSTLDTGDATDRLREAKKWYAVGSRADAFDDAEALAADIAALEETIETVEDAADQVNELTTTIPALRSALESDEPAPAQSESPSPAQTGL